MDEGSIDFRLLECLQTLVAERHVTKAAERLGMSQPKLSSALGRLRQLTGDPLLVRTSEGMMPTDVARQLASESGAFMNRWKSMVGSAPNFAPESAARTFRIQCTDFVLQDIITKAISSVRASAPGVAISVAPPHGTMRETLETGEIDLVIGYIPDVPQDLFISQLTTYGTCCIAATDHPRLGDALTFEDYLRESHVVMTFGRNYQPMLTEQYIDSLLAERSLTRHAAVYVSSHLAVPEIVAHSDLLAVLSRPLAEHAARRLPIRILETPMQMPPQHVVMVWHARTRTDSGHRWLRSVVRRSIAKETV